MGASSSRERGTPQGGVISPLLANLFLHYAFDMWMARNHPGIPFERYADDAICHCRSEEEARTLRASLEERFAECGLTLHPEKTKIVYCKDDDRRGTYPDQKFDFLGYTFRPRLSRGGGIRSASRSVRRPATKLSKRSARRSEAGRCTSAATRRWTIWRGCSTRTSVAGSTTTAATTSRLSIRPYGTSTASWHDGRIGSSSPCDGTGGEHSSGWRASRDVSHCCSLTGGCCRDVAEQWEPDEARVSRPVLRAPGGETPPGDSPDLPLSQ